MLVSSAGKNENAEEEERKMEKTDDEFSAGLITLGREYIELERGLRAEREKNEKAHQEMVEKCERQQAEAEYYCQGMSEMLDAACGEYRRREEELQKERAAREEDHQNCSALQRENKNMVAAVIMGGLIGSALRTYGPTWWKGLRRSLDTWWQPPPDEPSLR